MIQAKKRKVQSFIKRSLPTVLMIACSRAPKRILNQGKCLLAGVLDLGAASTSMRHTLPPVYSCNLNNDDDVDGDTCEPLLKGK
jgi:hypothetical protein